MNDQDDKPRVLWVIMRLRKWDSFEPSPTSIQIPASVSGPDGCIGFLEVYDDHDKALAEAAKYEGDTPIVPVQLLQKREDV